MVWERTDATWTGFERSSFYLLSKFVGGGSERRYFDLRIWRAVAFWMTEALGVNCKFLMISETFAGRVKYHGRRDLGWRVASIDRQKFSLAAPGDKSLPLRLGRCALEANSVPTPLLGVWLGFGYVRWTFPGVSAEGRRWDAGGRWRTGRRGESKRLRALSAVEEAVGKGEQLAPLRMAEATLGVVPAGWLRCPLQLPTGFVMVSCTQLIHNSI